MLRVCETCNNLNIRNIFSKQFRSVILLVIRQTLSYFGQNLIVKCCNVIELNKSSSEIFHKKKIGNTLKKRKKLSSSELLKKIIYDIVQQLNFLNLLARANAFPFLTSIEKKDFNGEFSFGFDDNR